MPSVYQLALTSWSIPWVASLALLLTALLYLRGWYLLRCAGFPSLPPWRAVSFLAGLLSLWIALAGPMDVFNDWLLTAHMLQHMLLMMIAPPLILLGAPLIPLVRGLPVFAAREFAGPFLNWRPAQRVGRAVTQPVFALVLMGLVMLGWHIPGLYDLALRSDLWHQFEHTCFFVTSLIFWWPVIQPWPSHRQWPAWAMVPYLVVADVQNTILSATLVFADRVLYPSYNEAPRVFGLTAREDQAAAGAIMWVVGSVVFLVPAMLIAVRCLTRRSVGYAIQRLPKRMPAFAGMWRRFLSKLGLKGTRGDAASAAVLFAVVGLGLGVAVAFAPADDDLDLLARQEAGELVISLYGPEHATTTGPLVFGVLVQNGSSVVTDARVSLSAVRTGGSGVGKQQTLGSPQPTTNKLMQAMSLELPEPGSWVIHIQESDSNQSADFAIPIEVVVPSNTLRNRGAVLLAICAAALLSLTFTHRRRMASKLSSRTPPIPRVARPL